VGFAGGWRVHDWKAEAARAAELDLQAREQARDAIRVDTAATGYETQRTATAERVRIIKTEVERVVDRPVYRDRECLDADGLRLVAQAIGAPTAAGEPAPALPAASAAR
jgi:hypothetical protein